MTTTDDLIAFVTARLDEDEAMAVAAAADVKRLAGRANWASTAAMVTDAEDPDWAIADLSPYVDDECLARHIARHDPARALREVTAKRAMVAYCADEIEEGDPEREHASEYNEGFYAAGRAVATWVLRDLAAIWSDHPDYRPEWK